MTTIRPRSSVPRLDNGAYFHHVTLALVLHLPWRHRQKTAPLEQKNGIAFHSAESKRKCDARNVVKMATKSNPIPQRSDVGAKELG